MRMKMSVAVVTVVVSACLAMPAVSTAAPTLTLQKNCSQYPPLHGIDISLSGLPPNTSLLATLEFPDGGGIGPAGPFTADANGNFSLGPFGSEVPGTFTVTVDWASGTLTESLEVNCAVPATTAECKNGGWRNFPGFENQGDCVSFVATGGKNPPSGH
jgi:hypothetical protein